MVAVIALVTLTLTFGNLPVTLTSAVTYSMQEELPENTPIGNVKQDARLADHYSSSDLALLRFSIVNSTLGSGRDGSSYFDIHSRSGNLKVAKRIDRDTLCFDKLQCSVVFDVAVKPVEFFQVITITVNIQDINDHAPDFPESLIQLTLPESTPLQTAFTLPAARDLDGYDLGIAAYDLDSTFGIFDVRARPNAREAISIELVVIGQLDREKVANYLFTITALDGGSPRRTGTLQVNVTVTDVNDNHPVFEQAEYSLQISESSREDTTILRVSAVDLDAGINAQITYGFTQRTYAAHGRIFAIDESSGDIYLTHPLDREVEAVHHLVVTALDAGSNSRLATAKVVVTVTDVNDNPPRIEINTLTADGQARIMENADTGTFVALMSVSDPDNAQNGNVVCDVSSAQFTLQLISENKYKIVTKVPLDRESRDRYTFMIDCHDNGDPRLTKQQPVEVVVADENDNYPVFIAAPYVVEMEENNAVGLSLLQVRATDLDTGENGRISFSILNDFSDQFLINPHSGVITLRANLDHEFASSIDLLVEARDNGEPAMSSRTTLRVDVLDVNDEVPVFLQEAPIMLVPENQLPGTVIGSLAAVDRDSPPFNVITYSVEPVDEGDLVVEVNPSTGQLVTIQSLDREHTAVFYFKATASNEGYESMQSSVTVSLYISDVNDNPPIIDFPSHRNNSIRISNRLSPMDFVTQLRAHDLDTDNNSRLTFALLNRENQASDVFGIDQHTGVVYSLRDLSRLTPVMYGLTVRVADNGRPNPLYTTASLNIVVDSTLRPPVQPGVTSNATINTDKKTGDHDDADNKNNLIIIIAVVAGSSVIILILLAAIVFVIMNGRRSSARGDHIPCNKGDTVNAIDEFDEFKHRPGVDDDDDDLHKKEIFMVELSPVEQEACWSDGEPGHVMPPPPSPGTLPDPDHPHYVPDVVAHSRSSAAPASSNKDEDMSDESCGDLSNADSGRGGSEEGDTSHAGSQRPRAAPRSNSQPYPTPHSTHNYSAMRGPVPTTSTFHPNQPAHTTPRRPHQPTSLPASSSSRTLTLPHQCPAHSSRPIHHTPLPPSPTPSDTPSASIRPSLRSCKLLDKYERQQVENRDAYRGSYSLLHDHLHKMDDTDRSPSPHPRSKFNNLNANSNGKLPTKMDVDNSFV